MDEALIDEWNKIVGPKDEVWVLGDFAFGKPPYILEQLKRRRGRKHLVFGNHDREIEKHPARYLSKYVPGTFDTIQYYKELKHVCDHRLFLFHYACRVWKGSHHNSIHLHGHSHGSLEPGWGRSLDVGVDCRLITDEYRPIALDEILEYMRDRPFKVVDHHGMPKVGFGPEL